MPVPVPIEYPSEDEASDGSGSMLEDESDGSDDCEPQCLADLYGAETLDGIFVDMLQKCDNIEAMRISQETQLKKLDDKIELFRHGLSELDRQLENFDRKHAIVKEQENEIWRRIQELNAEIALYQEERRANLNGDTEVTGAEGSIHVQTEMDYAGDEPVRYE
ncbi:hypothetical protein BV25DRAFT_1818261 [Artomyces pyxidatus]|uniref:Uncharacterized protein n=1 Tax=Artomyces pyxidatus TaxID=48021 RepID=A0ACB8TLI7_9AGAM|nr:hypothetical protein BV25DRAFT_1818261 [Artomyces pyxidatus]